MSSSKYEAMRTNPGNWKLGIIYYCADDPRVVVKQRFLFGWTWNFANRWVFPGILAAVSVFIGPAAFAWYLGIRSIAWFGVLFVMSLSLLMLCAQRLSRDPLGPL